MNVNIKTVGLNVYPFPDDHNLKEKHVKWFRWEDVNDRIIKNELSGTVHELYKYTETTVKSFLPHCFVKRKQEESYQSDKVEAQNPESTIMMLQMDYAENYSCSAQDEVQSAHWNQAQVTLYTSVSWFRDKILSQVIISDTQSHKSTVVPFTDILLEET